MVSDSLLHTDLKSMFYITLHTADPGSPGHSLTAYFMALLLTLNSGQSSLLTFSLNLVPLLLSFLIPSFSKSVPGTDLEIGDIEVNKIEQVPVSRAYIPLSGRWEEGEKRGTMANTFQATIVA